MHKGNNPKKSQKGLFAELSLAQIVAGALAAVTSMLLASRIGIAGSVIGVAVGSIVSAVASQLYRRFLMASAEKLRDLKPGDILSNNVDTSSSVQNNTTDQQNTTSSSNAGGRAGALAQGKHPAPEGVDAVLAALAGATQQLPLRALDSARPRTIRRSLTPRVGDVSLRGDITIKRVHMLHNKRKKIQRGIIIVSVVSALLAVAVSALIVDLCTNGQGFGGKFTSTTSTQLKASDKQRVGAAAPSPSDSSHAAKSADESSSSSGDTPPDHQKDSDAAKQPSSTSPHAGQALPGGQESAGSSSTGGTPAGGGSGQGGSVAGSGSGGGSSGSAGSGSGSGGGSGQGSSGAQGTPPSSHTPSVQPAPETGGSTHSTKPGGSNSASAGSTSPSSRAAFRGAA